MTPHEKRVRYKKAEFIITRIQFKADNKALKYIERNEEISPKVLAFTSPHM